MYFNDTARPLIEWKRAGAQHFSFSFVSVRRVCYNYTVQQRLSSSSFCYFFESKEVKKKKKGNQQKCKTALAPVVLPIVWQINRRLTRALIPFAVVPTRPPNKIKTKPHRERTLSGRGVIARPFVFWRRKEPPDKRAAVYGRPGRKHCSNMIPFTSTTLIPLCFNTNRYQLCLLSCPVFFFLFLDPFQISQRWWWNQVTMWSI